MIKNKKQERDAFFYTSSDRIEKVSGGGCIGCFGLPFLLGGLFILGIVLQIIPVSNASEMQWWGWLIFALMGIVFTGVGSGLIFGRSWVTIDKSKRKIWMAWGLIKPMRGCVYDLSDFEKIVLKFVAGDSDTADSFPIVLRGDNIIHPINNMPFQRSVHGGNELIVASFQTYGKAYEQAKLLMEFLRFPFIDQSTDNKTILDPKQEYRSSKQTQQIVEIPDTPQNLSCKVSKDHESLRIMLPSKKFNLFVLFELAIPLAIVSWLYPKIGPFLSSSQTPAVVQFYIYGFLGLFFILIPVISLLSKLVSFKQYDTVILIEKRAILIQRFVKQKTKIRIAFDSIFNIDFSTSESAFNKSVYETDGFTHEQYATTITSNTVNWMLSMRRKHQRSGGISIKSKEGIYTFGEGLPDDEVYYLFTLIVNDVYSQDAHKDSVKQDMEEEH